MGNSCTKPKQKSDSTALSKLEEVRFSNYHLGEDNSIQQGITTVKSKAADELTDALIYGDEPDIDGKISAYNEADESGTEPGSPETTGVEDQEPRTPLSPSSPMLEFRQPSSPTQSTPYKSNSAVKVALVVRPLFDWDVKTELDPMTKQPSTRGHKSVAVVLPPSKVRMTVEEPGRPVKYDEYEFDRVYSAAPGRVASKGLNSEMVAPVLAKYFAGFNATVLAYGQTGSGKTYTMGTTCGKKELASSHPSNPVIPWALQELFKYLGEATKTHEVTLLLSYIEIYKENIHDLLLSPLTSTAGRSSRGGSVPATPGPLSSTAGRSSRGGSLPPTPPPPPTERLDVKMRPGGELYVAGALEVAVTSQEHLIGLLERGNNLRSTAAHKLNAHSSRSHAIVTLRLEQRVRASAIEQVDSEHHFLRSKLHLVDLAGSERLDDTGAEGLTMEEGIKINKGLHVLGKVIEALTDRERVPYRESMLTKVLQDSLGGNSETLFIACISPSDSNVGHTLSTLRYASRAMKIENVVTLNNYLSPEEEIAYLKGALSHAQMSLTREQARSARLEEQLEEQVQQVARLAQLLQERGAAEQSGPGTPAEPSCEPRAPSGPSGGSSEPSGPSEASGPSTPSEPSEPTSDPIGPQGADSSSPAGLEADAPASGTATNP